LQSERERERERDGEERGRLKMERGCRTKLHGLQCIDIDLTPNSRLDEGKKLFILFP